MVLGDAQQIAHTPGVCIEMERDSGKEQAGDDAARLNQIEPIVVEPIQNPHTVNYTTIAPRGQKVR